MTNSESAEVEEHAGHDLESGMLERVREWTDIFPWIRLGRVLRIAGSPPMVFVVALALCVSDYGGALMFDRPTEAPDLLLDSWTSQLVGSAHDVAGAVFPISIFALSERNEPLWIRVGQVIWSLLVWTPAILFLLRQGALLTAGRQLTGFMPGLKMAAKRTPTAWLLSLVPLICVSGISVAVLIVGWLSRLGTWTEIPGAIIAAFIAIPCGILAFGAYVAVPIGWAALVNEKEPDALDSLSRGYEYLYRRPMQLVLYSAIAMGLLVVVVLITQGVSIAGQQVTTNVLSVAGASDNLISLTREYLQLLPKVVALALFWGFVGGIYLLLRQAAGAQEVEDIWEPPHPSLTPLPELNPIQPASDSTNNG